MRSLLFLVSFNIIFSQVSFVHSRNPKNFRQNEDNILKTDGQAFLQLPKELNYLLMRQGIERGNANRAFPLMTSMNMMKPLPGPTHPTRPTLSVVHAPPPRLVSNPPPDHSNNLEIELNEVTNGKEETWPLQSADTPRITHLDVKCEKNSMKVSLEFDKPFNGVIFSKGHYNYRNCLYLPANTGRKKIFFDISINSCGTTGNAQGTFYNEDVTADSGVFFENTIIVQYDPQVQEAWDQARKLRCTWHDQYEKAVSFRPFPVDMLDVVRADFAGDNVGCWMQIQVGKGPWASEVAGIVKIGQTMTMVLAIKDEENKFDMLVRNCIAHDSKHQPIELVDANGCILRPKLMTKFTKIKNFGSSASVLAYTHFQAFKFPDSMEVHFQCTIQICRYQCPEQCSHQAGGDVIGLYNHGELGGERKRRDTSDKMTLQVANQLPQASKEVGLNRAINVVSPRDLTFPLDPEQDQLPLVSPHTPPLTPNSICITTFTLALSLLLVAFACVLSTVLILVLFKKRLYVNRKTRKLTGLTYLK